jgi:hypothetical protein
MVKSLLAGTKTQTRRVLSAGTASFGSAPRDFWQHGNFAAAFVDGRPESGQYLHVPSHRDYVEVGPPCDCERCNEMGWEGTVHRLWPRIEVGGRLYVREAWRLGYEFDSCAPSVLAAGTMPIAFEADAPHSMTWIGKFRQGMHMPRWASRLTLTVTEVRVQRLQDITETDARAEGVLWVPGHGEITPAELSADPGYSNFLNCREGYQVLWDHLNASRGFGWSTNPWVVAVSFSVARGNIDQVGAA